MLLAPLWLLLLLLRGPWERLTRCNRPLGAWGESWAAWYLRAHGCTLLGRNVRPRRHEELDIVARRGPIYLFVEVKSRRTGAFARPLVAIDTRKRNHLRSAATHWLAQRGLLTTSLRYRFDAIEVIGLPGRGRPTIRWVQRLDLSRTRAPDLYD